MVNNAGSVRPLLQVEELKMYFPITKGLLNRQCGTVKAVDNVSFQIERGKTLGLVGESGCGKTTTGKCILRVNKATSGRVIYEGVDLLNAPKEKTEPFQRDIQLIFQDPYGSLDRDKKPFR